MVSFKKIAWALAFLLGVVSFAPALAQTTSTGQLINLNGTVYLVGSSGLYGFPSLAVFNSWGYNLNQITTATSAESAMTMVGLVPTMQAGCDSPIDQINGNCSGISGSVRAGQLININGTVYYVTSTGLYGFPNAATFYSWNYTFSQIVPANTAEGALPVLGLVPSMQTGCATPLAQINGTCAGGTAGVSAGALINLQGTVYLVGSSGLYGFPNAATFYSWGFTFSQIVAANSAEASLPVLGLVPTKNANCGTPLNQIAGSCASPTPTPTTTPTPTATPTPSPAAATPFISSLSPSAGAVGSTITINGTGFTAANNTITFGIGSFTGYSSNGTSLSFTIPSSVAPTCAAGTACPQYVLEVTPNNYNITVSNSNGTSAAATFTVTSPTFIVNNCQGVANSGSQCLPKTTLSSVSPASAGAGTLVTITGSNFTSTGNTVTLISTQNTLTFPGVASSNYTSVSITIPAAALSGSYSVTVSNSLYGSSNSLNLSVTN
jgi:hypothetical protein